MCGIIGGFTQRVDNGVGALAHRGPDAMGTWESNGMAFGHTRLAIIDTDHRSDQPFHWRDLVLTYNGELWNHASLRAELAADGIAFATSGDTEVVAAALGMWGPAVALPKFQGMFAMAWAHKGDDGFQMARDRFGEVPLHYASAPSFTFASEIKGLIALGANLASARWFEPGTWARIEHDGRMVCHHYHDIPLGPKLDIPVDEAARLIYEGIAAGAIERTISDVPVCTLLSGGIDSSSIAFHLARHFTKVTAYTAVYDLRARDLRCARIVAEDLGIELREVYVPAPDAQDLAMVAQMIEMPHKAQVEIGWPCLKLAEQMRADGFKVTFSGEGSDELWGSYGFSYYALKTQDWHTYRRDLFLGQHRKNFARCNKIFMVKGVECRLPFLNTGLVETAIRLARYAVRGKEEDAKAVMRAAYQGLLPDVIVRRSKVAFQDGMGIKKKAAEAVVDPQRYYRSVITTNFSGWRP